MPSKLRKARLRSPQLTNSNYSKSQNSSNPRAGNMVNERLITPSCLPCQHRHLGRLNKNIGNALSQRLWVRRSSGRPGRTVLISPLELHMWSTREAAKMLLSSHQPATVNSKPLWSAEAQASQTRGFLPPRAVPALINMNVNTISAARELLRRH